MKLILVYISANHSNDFPFSLSFITKGQKDFILSRLSSIGFRCRTKPMKHVRCNVYIVDDSSENISITRISSLTKWKQINFKMDPMGLSLESKAIQRKLRPRCKMPRST